MTDIHAVRERLEDAAGRKFYRYIHVDKEDIIALLADHARLQNEVSGALPGPVTIDREGSRDKARVGATAALAKGGAA